MMSWKQCLQVPLICLSPAPLRLSHDFSRCAFPLSWSLEQASAGLADSLFCITCSLKNNAFSVLHYIIKVTLQYEMFHLFKIHSVLEFSRAATALLCCRLAASRLRAAARWQWRGWNVLNTTCLPFTSLECLNFSFSRREPYHTRAFGLVLTHSQRT